MFRITLYLISFFLLQSLGLSAQGKRSFCITGYYAGPAERLDHFPVEKLTNLIYSFGHLRGNQLHFGSANDTACIRKMVGYKKKYPGLKIILSLGGWGGCRTCSDIFSSDYGRNAFSLSVIKWLQYFKADGIDLDWEYPAIAGYPDHPFKAEDKSNFTRLLRSLRTALGNKYEISFAAGGFDQFIDSSVEWKEAMGIADKVYIMSYDLVHGNSTVSGHHTPLYSTPQQKQSAGNAVNRLLEKGVPAGKIVIGAAFYARMFRVKDTIDRGLYRSCSFYRGVSHPQLYDSISSAKGFTQYWDDVAKAPYAFNPQRKILVTYDDSTSVRLKTQYALDRGLGGIMFWQLADDKFRRGLLDVIYEAAREQ